MRISWFRDDRPVTDVVVLQTGFIGDIVLTSGLLSLLKSVEEPPKVHLVTTEVGKQIYADQDIVDRTIVFKKRGPGGVGAMRSVKKELFAEMADPKSAVLLQAHRSYRSSLLRLYLGCKAITYQETSLSMGAFTCPRVMVFHECQRIALLAEPLGVPREAVMACRPVLKAVQSSGQWASRLTQFSGRVIGVAPGSVWGTKRWPIENYAELVRRLLDDRSNLVVLIGSPEERQFGEEILGRVAVNDRLIDLIGRTRLGELSGLYSELDLLIANDSSPVHFASAANTPTIALFGATTSSLGFGPLAKKSFVIENNKLECRPCSDHGPMTCPLEHFECMRSLGIEAVLSKIAPNP